MNPVTKSLIVELCWLSIALVTIVLSILTAKDLLDLQKDLNRLHDGKLDNIRTCLFRMPDTNDCSNPDTCTTYVNPAANNDDTFMASKFFSCKDREFCRNFFQATEGNVTESAADESIAALSEQWNNALTYEGVNIPYLFVGSLMARALSGALAAFLEMFQMCRIRLSRSFLKFLLYLKNTTGVLSSILFFAIGALLYTLDSKSIITDVVDARCYDFQGLSILVEYRTTLNSARVEQIAFSIITIFTLIGETLTFDDDFAAVTGPRDKKYAEHVSEESLNSRLITNETDDIEL